MTYIVALFVPIECIIVRPEQVVQPIHQLVASYAAPIGYKHAPITLDACFRLLDGQNRLAALKQLRVGGIAVEMVFDNSKQAQEMLYPSHTEEQSYGLRAG